MEGRSRKGVDSDMKRGSIFVLACVLLFTVVPSAMAAYNPDYILNHVVLSKRSSLSREETTPGTHRDIN